MRDFWLLAGAFFICGATTNGLIGTHLIAACSDHGLSEVRGAGLLAVIGVFDVVGTICSGWLTDRFDPRWLLFWYYGLRGMALLGLNAALSHAGLGLVAFVVFYGLDWVATVPPTVALVREVFGRERVGVVFAWVFACHQFGAAFAAWGAGASRTWFGSYEPAFLVAGALGVTAAALSLSIGRRGLLRPTPITGLMPRRPDHVDPPDPPLSDGTVTLRPMHENDLPGLMEEGRDETTRRWVNVPIPYTEQHAREELTQLMGSWDDPTAPLAFTITERGSDQYRGVILLSTERPPGIVEVAYGVHPAARRRGLVTRAIRLVSPWAFEALGAERLEGRTDPENIASQRALEQAGFTREGLERGSRSVQGVRKDMICWSLLPSDLD